MEKYDPKQNVCGNQDDFNMAVREAAKYTEKQELEKMKPMIYVYLVLWFIFITWAVMLALKVSPQDRVIHLVFAIMAPPVYVLASYLGK